jgi:homopolymeric O-antigen transport system permease protein
MISHSTFLRGGAQVWTWRGFILASAIREIRSRYARSLFGWVWLVVPPAVLIGIYALVFSRLMRGAGLPDLGPYTYAIFLCAGLLTWQWFSDLLARVVGLFTNHATLLKKTTVPWYALLTVDVLVTGFGAAVQMGLFAGLLLALGLWPGWAALSYIPLFFAQGLLAVGLGLGLAVLQVFFRDVGLALPLVLNVWFWMSAIVYPLSALPGWAQELLQWNLMMPLVQGYQNVVIRPAEGVAWGGVATVAAVAAVALLFSLRLMHRNRGLIRDEI